MCVGILFTAASDSEDFGATSLDTLPPSGQEARPGADLVIWEIIAIIYYNYYPFTT